MPPRRGRWAALVSAILLIAVAGAQASPARLAPLGSNDLVAHPEVWRAFRPVVRFAGDGDSERALRYLRRGSAILRAADADLRMDPAIEEFREGALASMEDFDFAGLYALLPERRGVYRRWTFEGHPLAQGYRVASLSDDDAEVRPDGARRQLGESSGVLRVRELAEGNRYLVHFRGGVGLGDVTWPSVLGGMQDMVRVVDTAWGHDAPMILQAAEAYLKKSQPGLGREDRRVLSRMWASFPAISQHMIGLSHIEDVLAPSEVEGCSQLQITSRWDPSRVAKHYPALADYMQGFGDLAQVHSRLHDGAGHLLAETWLDTATLTMRLQAFVKDGAVVPSEAGRPLPQVAPDLGHMVALVDMRVVLRGMQIYLSGLRVELTLKQGETGASLHASMREVPTIRIEGAAFGLIPAGMVDWFIPGDLQGLTEGFYRRLVKGNEGRGLAAFLRFDRPDGTDGATADGSAGAEVLDSPLIRFALRVLSGHLIPDADERADMRRLALAYRDAFDSDLDRFARFGVPVVAAAWRAE